MQAYGSITRRYFCIEFTDFMLNNNGFIADFSNLFSLNN